MNSEAQPKYTDKSFVIWEGKVGHVGKIGLTRIDRSTGLVDYVVNFTDGKSVCLDEHVLTPVRVVSVFQKGDRVCDVDIETQTGTVVFCTKTWADVEWDDGRERPSMPITMLQPIEDESEADNGQV